MRIAEAERSARNSVRKTRALVAICPVAYGFALGSLLRLVGRLQVITVQEPKMVTVPRQVPVTQTVATMGPTTYTTYPYGPAVPAYGYGYGSYVAPTQTAGGE